MSADLAAPLPIAPEAHAEAAGVARERWMAVMQIIVNGGPLLIGALFPIGVPLYSTLLGPIGKYNCLMHTLTGEPCPACGLTSSVISTMHGRPLLALAYHPAGVAIALLFGLGLIGGIVRYWHTRRPLTDSWFARFVFEFPTGDVVTVLVAGLMAIYVGRMTTWWP